MDRPIAQDAYEINMIEKDGAQSIDEDSAGRALCCPLPAVQPAGVFRQLALIQIW